MPNPLFLQVMGVSIHEYNAYSPAKKARFQAAATKKLAEVHETDIAAYNQLTNDTAKALNASAIEDAEAVAEDQENS